MGHDVEIKFSGLGLLYVLRVFMLLCWFRGRGGSASCARIFICDVVLQLVIFRCSVVVCAVETFLGCVREDLYLWFQTSNGTSDDQGWKLIIFSRTLFAFDDIVASLYYD